MRKLHDNILMLGHLVGGKREAESGLMRGAMPHVLAIWRHLAWCGVPTKLTRSPVPSEKNTPYHAFFGTRMLYTHDMTFC
jgi:hypothetical protein